MSKKQDSINKIVMLYCTLGMLVITVANFAIFIYDRYEKVGMFMVTVNEKDINTPVNRNILVYMDKDSTDLSEIDGIFPLLSNPAKYTLLDVSLKYTIEADSANISYSNDYKIDDISQGKRVTNINDKLYAVSDLSSPFNHFVMKDNGQAAISLRATYQGVKDPFLYQSKIFAKKIIGEDESKRKRSIFIDADIFFTLNSDIEKIDLYILNQDSVCLFENYTKDSVYRQYSYNYGRMRGYKPRQNTESLSGPQAIEKDNMPWYMDVVECLLSIVFIFGAAFLVYLLMIIIINEFKQIKSEFKYRNIIIFTVVSSVLSYIALFYLMQIFFPEVENFNWQLPAWIYGIIDILIIVILLIEKLFNSTNKQ